MGGVGGEWVKCRRWEGVWGRWMKGERAEWVRVSDNSIIDRARHTLGAHRYPSVSSEFPTRKPHAVAPGGPPEGQCKRETRLLGDWQSHAVAAGLVPKAWKTTIVDPLPTCCDTIIMHKCLTIYVNSAA